MTQAPPLNDGEVIVFDHIPNLGKYKKAALILLGVSLLPTAAFAAVLPDTYWVILPLFLSCILLVQERFKLGRHRAWITNQRIILQDGSSVALGDVADIKQRSIFMHVRYGSPKRTLPLYYPADAKALAQAITHAKEAI